MIDVRSRRSAGGKNLSRVDEGARLRGSNAHAQNSGVGQHAVGHAERAIHQLRNKADRQQQHEVGGHQTLLSLNAERCRTECVSRSMRDGARRKWATNNKPYMTLARRLAV